MPEQAIGLYRAYGLQFPEGLATHRCHLCSPLGPGCESMAAAEAEVVSPLIVDTAPDTSGTAEASVAASVAEAARTESQAPASKAALAAKLMSLSGVFAVHKPKGPTSAELLNRLKEKLLAGTAARVGTRLRSSPPHWDFYL